MGERMHMLKSNNEKYFENSDNNDPYENLLRLKGGGENSLSTSSSAWGTTSSEPSNNSNGKMTTNTSQQSPDNGVWGQSSSKSQPNAPSNQSGGSPSNQNVGGPSATTKQQLEQLQTLREAIFSQDGWGVQYVNQDTSWDIPSSPEPANKVEGSSGSSSWKPNVNNGTELWEANLKNGGQPPPQSQPQQKTPWGHTPSNNIGGTWGEDDESESSNVWTGASQNQTQQWGPGNGNANNNPMWNGSKKEDEWAANGNGNWRDQRNPDHRTMGTDSRDNRQGNRGANNPETIRLLEHREQMRQIPGEMRGDPRGITGRLNGTGNDTFWGQSGHGASQAMPQQKMHGTSNGIGWEDAPLNTPKRTTFDDGTSLWGNPQQGSHWKDLPVSNISRNNMTSGPLGMNQPRMKPDVPLWGNGRNNGPWDEMGGQLTAAAWDEPNSWAKQKMTNPLWENDLDWGQKPNKLHLTKEIIWNSKQFRMLVDLGHKKEDVENALRMRDMNVEEALELLTAIRRPDSWGNRTDDHYDAFGYNNQKYPLGPNVPMPNFPPSNNDPNLMNLISNTVNSNPSAANNAFIQKMLLQSGGGAAPGLGNNPAANNRNVPTQPSTQQLKMLVGQIQLAVQAGFLNNQILKQPLAPQTLALLNQLLQQIKILQQLVANQIHLPAFTANGKPNSAYVQYSLIISKTKQSIASLQTQISTQQAAYVKQHMGEVIKPPLMHEPMGGIQNTFAEMNINKEPQAVQQSKLNQWINKDKDGEFCRAPGANSKLIGNSNFGVTPSEGNWANGRSADTGWPDGSGDSANEKDSPWSTSQSITDLVPEFEPGKPWKGNQLKSIEDDPTITPGSVVRSPLSIPTIKDPKLYNANPVKGLQETDNISSFGLNSTWSNNPPPTTSSGKLPNSDPSISSPLTSDLWTTPKQSKGPPGFSDDSWSNNNSASWGASQRNSGNWAGSTWLLLKNLTAQIDGSTLRTLCMQHGPLMSFNLYLYQGFALAKYSSREEAVKAQTALNNCVLGNTTILAENPSDWDASALLQQLATQQNGSSGGNWRGSTKQAATESWNVSWPSNTSSANLWSSPSVDCNDPRGTPSNLNSFLPNDLLGGESI